MPKDHYVPQFYLRNFEQDGSFWVIDKTKKKSWKSNAYKTAKIDNFYTFREKSGKLNDSIEGKLSKLEGRWKDIISELCIGKKLTPNETPLIHQFVAVQFLRTPYSANRIGEMLEAFQRAQLEFILSQTESTAEFLRENPEYDEESLRKEVLQGQFPKAEGADISLSLGQFSEIINALRAKEGMAVITAPEGIDLITSDHPVNAWLPTGLHRGKMGPIAASKAEIWCPLSPKKAIYIGPHSGIVGREQADFCLEMNYRLICDAERFLISATENPNLEEHAFKAPAPKRKKEALFQMAQNALLDTEP